MAKRAGKGRANGKNTGMARGWQERCGGKVDLSKSGAEVGAKEETGLSGSYRLIAYQGMPNGATDAGLSGRFSGSGRQDTVLARTHLGLGYVVAGGFRGMDEIRDAEYGQDAALHVDLAVYDERGRLICRSQTPAIQPS